MELAATALAQAVGKRGERKGRESESSEEEEEEEEKGERLTSSIHTKPQVVDPNTAVRVQLKKKQLEGRRHQSDTSIAPSNVTIDALVSILQDPDRGVPRALETRLKDVKIRRGELLYNTEGVKIPLIHLLSSLLFLISSATPNSSSF